jgi:hypothetical protein
MSLCATAAALVALALPGIGERLAERCEAGPAAPAAPLVDRSPPPRRSLAGALRAAHRSGAMTWRQRRHHERALRVARLAARRLPADRARELGAVLGVADDLAAAGRLGAPRLRAVMRTIAFNRRA